jgi:hypothetical protein
MVSGVQGLLAMRRNGTSRRVWCDWTSRPTNRSDRMPAKTARERKHCREKKGQQRWAADFWMGITKPIMHHGWTDGDSVQSAAGAGSDHIFTSSPNGRIGSIITCRPRNPEHHCSLQANGNTFPIQISNPR